MAQPNSPRRPRQPGNGRVDSHDGLEQSTLGAERIRGELLKLGIRVSKRTIQKHKRASRPRRPHRQHAKEIWACDFLQTYDIFFRPLFAFVFIELATRKVVFASTTSCPS